MVNKARILLPRNNETPSPKEIVFFAFIIPKANLSISTERNRIRNKPISLTPQSKIGGKFIFIVLILLNDNKLESKGQIPICEKLKHEKDKTPPHCLE